MACECRKGKSFGVRGAFPLFADFLQLKHLQNRVCSWDVLGVKGLAIEGDRCSVEEERRGQ